MAGVEDAADRLRFVQGVLDALEAHVAVVDRAGRIVAVNRSWRQFAADNLGAGGSATGVGANYLDCCRADDPDAAAALDGLTAVLEQRLPAFRLEYPCHGPGHERWFVMSVTPFDVEGLQGAVISHANVTAERLRQRAEFADVAERRRVAAGQRELKSLEGSALEVPVAVTGALYGQRTLAEAAPEAFARLRGEYAVLLDRAIDRHLYKVPDEVSRHLRDVAAALGALGARARDVVDLHRTVLKERLRADPTPRDDAVLEEARIVVLELMGYLASFYRAQAFRQAPGAHSEEVA